jgi:hypothetical protein
MEMISVLDRPGFAFNFPLTIDPQQKMGWTNPLRGSRVIETTFSDFTGAIADDSLSLA